MDFGDYFREGLEIVRLNPNAVQRVANDQNATMMAVLFFAIGGIASALLTINPIAWISAALFSVIFSFIGVGLLHLLAKLFGGTGTYMQLYRPEGIGSIISWLSIIPIIGGIISLWGLAIAVVNVRTVHNISTGKAIIVVAIPVILSIILAASLAALFFAIFANTVGNIGNIPVPVEVQ